MTYCKARLAAVAAFLLVASLGCAALPDASALIERHRQQAARFENARGAISALQSAAIVAELKRRSGDIDILDKQIALEQAIVGSPLSIGNKVTLLQDGAATYPAMFAAIRQARDHINMESYIIDDDEIGQQFAELLPGKRRGCPTTAITEKSSWWTGRFGSLARQ